VIEIAVADLTVSELSLAAAYIDFQPDSSVSIKSLNVFAQWFVGATTGPFADIAYGSFTPTTGSRGTFAADPTVAAVDPLLSTDNMLLDTEALYTPTTSTLAPGTVVFDGVIQAEPVAYLLGTRQLSADQAVIKVLAKQTSISAVDSPGGLTSPFGPYAGVSNSQATSYGGLYYGFGATIEIDPAINEAQYISDPFADFLAAYGEEAAEDIDLYAADGLDGFEDTSEEELLGWSDDSGDSDGDGYSDDDQDLALDADAFDLADGGDGFAPSEQGADGTAAGLASDVTVAAAPAVPTVAVSATEATNNFNSTELSSLQQTAGALGLGAVQALSPQQAQQALRQAIQAVRGQPRAGARSADGSSLIAASVGSAPATLPQQFNRAAYNPAIVQLRFTEAKGRTAAPDSDAFLDITLIQAEGEVIGKRVEVSTSGFVSLLKDLYRQLARQEDLRTRNPGSAARRLYSMLLAPLEQELNAQKITTLLIGADRGLQGVPYAALHSGHGFLGERFAFALTPSLSLTNLTPVPSGEKRLLAAGASRFDGLAPLPLVPEELRAIGASQPSDVFLNAEFTPATLEVAAADPRYDRIHLATHAEFLPGGPTSARLYSGQGSMSLASLANLRKQRRGVPLDLIVFSACRTALGDADSELGFAGLALQAGARSAIGTLWYVDDVATSAYFIQAYRYLQQGIPKAEALQFTRRDFVAGRVQLTGDQIIGSDGQVLLSGLTVAQQRRVGSGLANPFYWAGIELLGAPW
jgi:CHAT domain-containing protein